MPDHFATRASVVTEHEVPEWLRLRLLHRFGPTPAGSKDGYHLLTRWSDRHCSFRYWLDHWGSAEVDGLSVLVSEPHYLITNDFSGVSDFAAMLRCQLVVKEESYHCPGHTIRLALCPEEAAGKIV
jgi:hypothetical protein